MTEETHTEHVDAATALIRYQSDEHRMHKAAMRKLVAAIEREGYEVHVDIEGNVTLERREEPNE